MRTHKQSLKALIQSNENKTRRERNTTLTQEQYDELLVLWRFKTELDYVRPVEVEFALVKLPSKKTHQATSIIRQGYIDMIEGLLGLVMPAKRGHVVLSTNAVGDFKMMMGFGDYTLNIKYRKATKTFFITLRNIDRNFKRAAFYGDVSLLDYATHVASLMNVSVRDVNFAYWELVKALSHFNKEFVQTLPGMSETTGIPARIDITPIRNL